MLFGHLGGDGREGMFDAIGPELWAQMFTHPPSSGET